MSITSSQTCHTMVLSFIINSATIILQPLGTLYMQFIFFTAMLIINKIGYSLQASVTKAGQTVLTNHPKQRPLYAIFDSIYNIGVFTGGQIFVSNYLIAKHGNFTLPLFMELNSYGLIVSGLCAVLAIVGIWSRDKKEFYGLAEEGTKTTLREYWGIIKGNRPLQMLSISASFDKLAMGIARYNVVGVMFFGILLGDYSLSGTIGMITIVPTLLITFFVVGISRKTGLKKSYVTSAWIGILSFVALIALFLLIENPSEISLVLAFGIPARCLIVSITSMRFYNLDAKRMEEIQKGIAQKKAKVKKDEIAAS